MAFRSPACKGEAHFLPCAPKCTCWCHKLIPRRIVSHRPVSRRPQPPQKKDPFITALVVLIIAVAIASTALVLLLH